METLGEIQTRLFRELEGIETGLEVNSGLRTHLNNRILDLVATGDPDAKYAVAAAEGNEQATAEAEAQRGEIKTELEDVASRSMSSTGEKTKNWLFVSPEARAMFAIDSLIAPIRLVPKTDKRFDPFSIIDLTEYSQNHSIEILELKGNYELFPPKIIQHQNINEIDLMPRIIATEEPIHEDLQPLLTQVGGFDYHGRVEYYLSSGFSEWQAEAMAANDESVHLRQQRQKSLLTERMRQKSMPKDQYPTGDFFDIKKPDPFKPKDQY